MIHRKWSTVSISQLTLEGEWLKHSLRCNNQPMQLTTCMWQWADWLSRLAQLIEMFYWDKLCPAWIWSYSHCHGTWRIDTAFQEDGCHPQGTHGHNLQYQHFTNICFDSCDWWKNYIIQPPTWSSFGRTTHFRNKQPDKGSSSPRLCCSWILEHNWRKKACVSQ